MAQHDHNSSIPPIPPGSGIKIAGWQAAVADVRNLAPAHRRFEEIWTTIYKRHLRRYAGYGGCPALATVYYTLRQEFDDARGEA